MTRLIAGLSLVFLLAAWDRGMCQSRPAARPTPADTAGYAPVQAPEEPAPEVQEPVVTYPVPSDAAELYQGKVLISATDSGMYEVRRNDSIIGATPNGFTQRRGTERTYSVRDDRGRLLCERSVKVERAYQRIELKCDPKRHAFDVTGELKGAADTVRR